MKTPCEMPINYRMCYRHPDYNLLRIYDKCDSIKSLPLNEWSLPILFPCDDVKKGTSNTINANSAKPKKFLILITCFTKYLFNNK